MPALTELNAGHNITRFRRIAVGIHQPHTVDKKLAAGGRPYMKDKLAASRDIQTRAKVPAVITRRDVRIVRDRQSR